MPRRACSEVLLINREAMRRRVSIPGAGKYSQKERARDGRELDTAIGQKLFGLVSSLRAGLWRAARRARA